MKNKDKINVEMCLRISLLKLLNKNCRGTTKRQQTCMA